MISDKNTAEPQVGNALFKGHLPAFSGLLRTVVFRKLLFFSGEFSKIFTFSGMIQQRINQIPKIRR